MEVGRETYAVGCGYSEFLGISAPSNSSDLLHAIDRLHYVATVLDLHAGCSRFKFNNNKC